MDAARLEWTLFIHDPDPMQGGGQTVLDRTLRALKVRIGKEAAPGAAAGSIRLVDAQAEVSDGPGGAD